MRLIWPTRYLRMGERIPGFQGVAYRDYSRRITVIAPIPLNIIIAIGVTVYRVLRAPEVVVRLGDVAYYANQTSQLEHNEHQLRSELKQRNLAIRDLVVHINSMRADSCDDPLPKEPELLERAWSLLEKDV